MKIKNDRDIEENTREFYKELNGNCNPDQLLEIARRGIYLYEPLFKYDNIKNHVNVVEISILAGQYFMINNDEQFEEFDIFLSDDDSLYELFKGIPKPRYIFTKRDILKLIIPNKYFIDTYLFEGCDSDSDFKIKYSKITQEWLFYLYKYNYITRDDFINFYYAEYYRMKLQFFLFEYFYYGNKNYLDNLFEKGDIAIKFEILYNILNYYSFDINILKYCANKVKKYANIHISSNIIYKTYKKRKKEDCYGNICYKEKDKLKNVFCFYFIYVKEYFLSYMIDNFVNKQDYIKILYEGIDKVDLCDNININYNFINFLLTNNNNIQKYELSHSNRDCESILCFNDKYYNSYDFFDKLLKNPKYIFELNKYDNILCRRGREMFLLYYLISLVHNNIYNRYIIKFLLSTIFFNKMFIYKNIFNYFSLRDNKDFIQFCKIIKKIPHEEFRKYIEL